MKLADSKTGSRIVWLGDEARNVFDRFTRGRGDERVFFNPKYGAKISLPWFWKGVCTQAGVRSARLHDIRHKFASHGATMSETLPMIGKLLGHASVDSAVRYAHLDDADVMGACDRIGDLIAAMAA